MVARISARLAADLPVRRSLPVWGRVHIDRRLPFVVVYRRPRSAADAGTERLASGVASYIVTRDDPARLEELRALLGAVAGLANDAFGALLIVEVWAGSPDGGPDPVQRPAYRVIRHPSILSETADECVSALAESRILGQRPDVTTEEAARISPPGMRPLFTPRQLAGVGAYLMGVEALPVWRDAGSGEIYPVLIQQVGRRVTTALDRAAYRFTLNHTAERPSHYHVLGRRASVKAVREIDEALTEIAEQYDPLLLVTPVNAEQAFAEFRRFRYQRQPRFHYRPLPVDPARAKHRLWSIRTERVEDPTLMFLFRDTQRYLDRQLTLLADRGRPEFLQTSMQLYGGVESGLLGLAESLLGSVPVRARRRSEARLDAAEFAGLLTAEILAYREEHARFGVLPQVRDDLYAGVMTSRGRILVGSAANIPASRADALIQHELGTHVVTHHNGREQPFALMRVGLPGYDELQEGLAVLTEHLVGGLDAERMRVLAARVVAVHALTEGATFVEAWRGLRAQGFTQRAAFTIVTRVYRGGGLTKDAMYLRGLVGILDYLAEGSDFDRLFLGKYGVKHVPIVDELLLREVLTPPAVLPRYLLRSDARERLAAVRRGISVMDLLKGSGRS